MTNSTAQAKMPIPVRLALTTILGLAAFLRLYHLELVSITADEGIHGQVARQIALLKEFPMAGLPSVGIRNSGLFVYALAIPNFLSGAWASLTQPHGFLPHPLSGVIFVSALNILAVYLACRLAFEHFGSTAAIVTGLLYACSPWAVMYARNMWPPSCVAVASLWLMIVSLRWINEGGNRRLFTMVVLFFLIPQIHFSGFVAPVWILAVLWTGRDQLRWRPAVCGLMLGIATWSPWIAWQHWENDWLDLQQFSRTAKGSHGVAETLVTTLDDFHTLAHSGNFAFWFTAEAEAKANLFPRWLAISFVATRVMIIAALVASFAWAAGRARDPHVRLLLAWAALPIVMLAIIRPNVHPHYVNVAYPVPFLFIGAWAQHLAATHRPCRFALLSVVLILLTLGHLLFLAGWYRFIDEDRPTGQGHFQLSYRHRQKVALSILDDSDGRLIPLAGAFSGLNPSYNLIYTYELLRRDDDSARSEPSLRYWLDEGTGDRLDVAPDWVIEKHWNVGPTRIFRVRQRSASR